MLILLKGYIFLIIIWKFPPLLHTHKNYGMKKYFFAFAVLCGFTATAQTDFGFKGGLNYGDNGEVEFSDVSETGEDVYYGADRKVGYHFGAFLKSYLSDNLYLRPEVVYTNTKSSYNYNDQEADYDIKKIDVPILLGYDILKPLHIFAGPSIQYITDHDFEGISFGKVENEFTVGVQFGAGLQFGGIGLDVRYERGFTENEAEVLDFDNTLGGVQRIDARPNQFIVSLSVNL